MRSNQKVSVVIPTFNRADLIGRSLRSVLNQTHESIEVIVVDDASTDGTEDEVKTLSDTRVRYIRHGETRGPSATRNTGISSAGSDFVAFLDSDDEWVPEKLERQLAEFSLSSDIGFVFSGWAWVSVNRTVRVSHVPDARTGLIGGNPRWFYNVVQDIVVRREVAVDCVFNEHIWAYENLEWLLRLANQSRSGFVAEVLVRCHDHASHRASDSRSKKLAGLEFVLSSYASYLKDHSGPHFHMRLSAGALGLQEGDAGARRHLSAALKLRPFSARAWIRFLQASVAR